MRSLLIFCLSTIIPMGTASAAQLIGYHAEYDVKLASTTKEAQITSIEGKTAYHLSNDCDGWDTVEDYLMKFTYDTGEEYVLVSRFASWEHLDGSLYSFEITEESNYEEKLDFSGFAQSGPSALLNYSQNPDAPTSIPDDVVFPIGHTIEILQRAQDGQKTYFADVLFGAEPGRALKKASTIIGQKSSRDANPDITSPLIFDEAWPIQIAYFTADDKSGLPDYELSLLLQDNGIVQSYAVDYGDFALEAVLKSITPVEDNGC